MIKFLYSVERTNSFRPTPWHWSLDPFPAWRGAGPGHRAFLAAAKDFDPCISYTVYENVSTCQMMDRSKRAIGTFSRREDAMAAGEAFRNSLTPEQVEHATSWGGYMGSLIESNAPKGDGFSAPRAHELAVGAKLIRTKEKDTLMMCPASPDEAERIMMCTLRGGFRGGYSHVTPTPGAEILLSRESNKHCVEVHHLVVRLASDEDYVWAETGRRGCRGTTEIFSWHGYLSLRTEEFDAAKESGQIAAMLRK